MAALLVATLAVCFVAVRWVLIIREDRRIRRWQALEAEDKDPGYLGYDNTRDGPHEHRLFLLGFLQAPDAWSRPAGVGGNSEIARRVEVISYRPWVRAISRVGWKEGYEPWRREPAYQRLILALLMALCTSLAVLLLLAGAYLLLSLVRGYTAYIVAVGVVALALYWFVKWSR